MTRGLKIQSFLQTRPIRYLEFKNQNDFHQCYIINKGIKHAALLSDQPVFILATGSVY